MMKRYGMLFGAAMMSLAMAAGCGQPAATGSTTQNQSGVAPVYDTEASGTETESTQAPVQTQENSSTAKQIQTETSGVTSTGITEEEAKAAALSDAGVNESDVSLIRVKKDWDDGRDIYEVEFYVDREEYDYDIDLNTGTIISKDYDIDNDFYSTAQSSSGDVITEDEAVQIVLDRVDGASASDVRIKLDYDDGRTYYEGDVYYDKMEYEFEMDAYTGEIIEWSEELFDH